MLILSRRLGEIIRIDSKVQVMILDISRDHIKLGFEAPSIIRILRSELKEKKRIKKSRESN